MAVATYTVDAIQGEPRDWQSKFGGAMKSYRLVLKDVPELVELSQRADTPAPTVGQQLEGEIQPSQGDFPPKFKKAQRNGGGFGGGGGGGGMSPEREKRIVRQHSQTTAIALLRLAHDTGVEIKPVSVQDLLGSVKLVADALDKDAGV